MQTSFKPEEIKIRQDGVRVLPNGDVIVTERRRQQLRRPVTFLVNYEKWNAGELAGFPIEESDRLIAAGIARAGAVRLTDLELSAKTADVKGNKVLAGFEAEIQEEKASKEEQAILAAVEKVAPTPPAPEPKKMLQGLTKRV